jgi:hypothetical protein
MRGKWPAKPRISMRAIRGRYLRGRSITIPWRSITPRNTDREKALQIGTLPAVRAMRSILWAVS